VSKIVVKDTDILFLPSVREILRLLFSIW